MIKIVILYGGRSGEHEVSCTSAAAVLAHLSAAYDPILIAIDRDGVWYLQSIPEKSKKCLNVDRSPETRIYIAPGKGLVKTDGSTLDADIVFPVLHGRYGEDGAVQGLLESASLPYIGAGVLGSAIGMDKELCKRIWKYSQLPVVPWLTVRRGDTINNTLWEKAVHKLGPKLFIKPANEGSSLGVSLIHNESGFINSLQGALKYSNKILVEKAIDGREIECSVMGYDKPEAFPPGEIIPQGQHEFYDYDAKYIDPDGALLHVPADIPLDMADRIKELSIQAYRAIESGSFSRVDFLVENSTGEVFINEINTIPGMTSISLFPRMTAAGGLNFTTMLDRLIEAVRTA